ncbi:MAG: hypothetical protein U1E36_07680 [Rickettsiales bacterium]
MSVPQPALATALTNCVQLCTGIWLVPNAQENGGGRGKSGKSATGDAIGPGFGGNLTLPMHFDSLNMAGTPSEATS